MVAVPSTQSIGERTVVATGTLTLGAGDNEVGVTIQDLTFLWTFAEGDEIKIEVEKPSPKIVRFTIRGKIPLGGGAWSLKEVGTLAGKKIHLAWTATQFGASEHIRIFTYSFSTEA